MKVGSIIPQRPRGDNPIAKKGASAPGPVMPPGGYIHGHEQSAQRRRQQRRPSSCFSKLHTFYPCLSTGSVKYYLFFCFKI